MKNILGENPYSLEFTDEEVRVAIKESNEWNGAVEVIATVRKSLGIVHPP